MEPPPWPELRTTYGYEGTGRVLTVAAPEVGTDGTITVEGRLRAPDATLPRRLHCEFAVRASQPGVLGRTVTIDGRAALDVSTLDLPDGVSTG